jgi:KipI family sensor histidine kinase inhibitor
MSDYPRILPVGDSAVSVEFGRDITLESNVEVHQFAARVDGQAVEGVTELVPSYRSLLIHYSPMATGLSTITDAVRQLLGSPETTTLVGEVSASDSLGLTHEIPVLYGGRHGPDLERVSEHAGIPSEEVVAAHTSREYRVYMLGFLPGFPYLGGGDPAIACPRLSTPRIRVPQGAVGIAESQTGVYPMDSPGGWNLIGKTPVNFFDPESDPPVAVEAGSFIRFVSVDGNRMEDIERAIRSGEYEIPRSPAGQSSKSNDS